MRQTLFLKLDDRHMSNALTENVILNEILAQCCKLEFDDLHCRRLIIERSFLQLARSGAVVVPRSVMSL